MMNKNKMIVFDVEQAGELLIDAVLFCASVCAIGYALGILSRLCAFYV